MWSQFWWNVRGVSHWKSDVTNCGKLESDQGWRFLRWGIQKCRWGFVIIRFVAENSHGRRCAKRSRGVTLWCSFDVRAVHMALHWLWVTQRARAATCCFRPKRGSTASRLRGIVWEKFGRKSFEGKTSGKEEQVLSRNFRGNIYDLVPGRLSMEQGQRKQEKESRARQELGFTRDASVISQYLSLEMETIQKNTVHWWNECWFYKSIVAFPFDTKWLCGCAVSCFETSHFCWRNALHIAACSLSQLSHQRPLKDCDGSPEKMHPKDRCTIVKEAFRVSSKHRVSTRISLPPWPLAKYGLAWFHLTYGMTNSICVWWCVGWPTSVTEDGVNFVLAQEQALLLVDPIFHSMDASKCKTWETKHTIGVFATESELCRQYQPIAILQFRFQLGVWIAMVFPMQRDQFLRIFGRRNSRSQRSWSRTSLNDATLCFTRKANSCAISKRSRWRLRPDVFSLGAERALCSEILFLPGLIGKRASTFTNGRSSCAWEQNHRKRNLGKIFWISSGQKFWTQSCNEKTCFLFVCVEWHQVSWTGAEHSCDVEKCEMQKLIWAKQQTSFFAHVSWVALKCNAKQAKTMLTITEPCLNPEFPQKELKNEKKNKKKKNKIATWSYGTEGRAKKCVERKWELAFQMLNLEQSDLNIDGLTRNQPDQVVVFCAERGNSCIVLIAEYLRLVWVNSQSHFFRACLEVT